MPSIVWIALAIAIVILGTGTAISLQELPELAAKPIAEGSGAALTISGYGIAAGLVIFAIIAGLVLFRRSK